MAELQSHPKIGASWEGFALEQTLTLLETNEAYYWATHSGAELDLVFTAGGKRYGVEYKYSDDPIDFSRFSMFAETLSLTMSGDRVR